VDNGLIIISRQYLFCIIFNLFYNFIKMEIAMQVMIMVSEAGRMENTCNLPADLDKNGNVLKIYDYSLKELPINLDGTVTYNGKR
ncbi:hypothetical protein OHW10_07160, partial [Acinetobacter baumannii]|nr:hypothetical protein [Acinetobacter baumannii]